MKRNWYIKCLFHCHTLNHETFHTIDQTISCPETCKFTFKLMSAIYLTVKQATSACIRVALIVGRCDGFEGATSWSLGPFRLYGDYWKSVCRASRWRMHSVAVCRCPAAVLLDDIKALYSLHSRVHGSDIMRRFVHLLRWDESHILVRAGVRGRRAELLYVTTGIALICRSAWKSGSNIAAYNSRLAIIRRFMT